MSIVEIAAGPTGAREAPTDSLFWLKSRLLMLRRAALNTLARERAPRGTHPHRILRRGGCAACGDGTRVDGRAGGRSASGTDSDAGSGEERRGRFETDGDGRWAGRREGGR